MPHCIKLLKTEEAEKILALACADGIGGIKKMSDFERLAFMCKSLTGLAGNKLSKNFMTALYTDLGYEADVSLLGERDVQKQLWRLFYSGDAIVTNITATGEAPNYADLLALCLDFYNKTEKATSFDIDDLINCKKGLCKDSLVDTISELVDFLRSRDIKKIFFNIADFSYSRPDSYHAELAYKKALNGEKCNTEERSLLKLYILSELLKVEKIKVAFVINNSAEPAEKIISRLSQMKIKGDFSICFGADNEKIIASAAALCMEKNISSEIIFSEETDIATAQTSIEKLCYLIPITRIFPCKAIHGENGDKAFYQTLCRLLYVHCKTQYEAERCIKSIF